LPVTVFLGGLARRSESTKVTYGCGLDTFARCFAVESADVLVGMIKAEQLEPYATLDKFVSWLMMNGFAPKTVRTYLGAAINDEMSFRRIYREAEFRKLSQ
jgi:hypothetical protein